MLILIDSSSRFQFKKFINAIQRTAKYLDIKFRKSEADCKGDV